jgi:hypothetical protein
MHKSFRVTKVRAGAFVAAVAILGSAAGVFAYFAGSGTVTGVNGVPLGTSGGVFSVTATFDNSNSQTVTPGYGAMVFDVTVKNNTAKALPWDTLTATIEQDKSGNVMDANTGSNDVGCLASWFTLAGAPNSGGFPQNIPASTSGLGTITLTMPTNSGTDQNICEGIVPVIDITAN